MDTDALKAKIYLIWYSLGILLWFFILCYIVSYLRYVVILLAISILVAYVLTPLVSFFTGPIELHIKEYLKIYCWSIKLPLKRRTIVLHRKGFSLLGSIIVVYLILIILFLLTVVYLLPIITEQFNLLVLNKATYIKKITDLYNGAYNWAAPRFPHELDQYLPDITTKIVEELRDYGIRIIQRTIPVVTHILTYIAMVFITPFVTFYILIDVDKIKAGFMALIPEKRKEEFSGLLHEIDLMLGRYIRGQIVVCVVIGVTIAIAMWIMGIQYSALIGVFAGIVYVIPYVGIVVGIIPAVLIALFKSPLYALIVLIVLILIHWAEGHTIVPMVMGQSLGLPPLVVIIALIIGAETMGILGMFLAVPIASVVRVVINHYIRRLTRGTNPLEPISHDPCGR